MQAGSRATILSMYQFCTTEPLGYMFLRLAFLHQILYKNTARAALSHIARFAHREPTLKTSLLGR